MQGGIVIFLYKVDDKISLKLSDLNDAEKIYELIDKSREYLREWATWVDFTKTVEDSKEYIQDCLKEYAENKGMDMLILFNDEIVGRASFNNINSFDKIAEIGYWLGEEFQGMGIMTKVVRALTDYAFHHLHLNKVEIIVASENKKSRCIPERLGFIEEGTRRQAQWLYNRYVDHVIYGTLVEEWEQSQ